MAGTGPRPRPGAAPSKRPSPPMRREATAAARRTKADLGATGGMEPRPRAGAAPEKPRCPPLRREATGSWTISVAMAGTVATRTRTARRRATDRAAPHRWRKQWVVLEVRTLVASGSARAGAVATRAPAALQQLQTAGRPRRVRSRPAVSAGMAAMTVMAALEAQRGAPPWRHLRTGGHRPHLQVRMAAGAAAMLARAREALQTQLRTLPRQLAASRPRQQPAVTVRSPFISEVQVARRRRAPIQSLSALAHRPRRRPRRAALAHQG